MDLEFDVARGHAFGGVLAVVQADLLLSVVGVNGGAGVRLGPDDGGLALVVGRDVRAEQLDSLAVAHVPAAVVLEVVDGHPLAAARRDVVAVAGLQRRLLGNLVAVVVELAAVVDHSGLALGDLVALIVRLASKIDHAGLVTGCQDRLGRFAS